MGGNPEQKAATNVNPIHNDDKNEAHDTKYNRGKTYPIIDPADVEEDETETQINLNLSPVENKSKKKKKTKKKKNKKNANEVNEKNKNESEKAVANSIENDSDGAESTSQKIIKKQDQNLAPPLSSQPCHKTLRNFKGLKCIAISTVSSHPSGTLSAFVIIFFFCYCAVRRGARRWRKSKRDGRARGEYAALPVYDELLESFDDEELSSLYQSYEGSDSSVSTILSEWSGNNPKIEMTSVEDDLDTFLKSDKLK